MNEKEPEITLSEWIDGYVQGSPGCLSSLVDALLALPTKDAILALDDIRDALTKDDSSCSECMKPEFNEAKWTLLIVAISEVKQ